MGIVVTILFTEGDNVTAPCDTPDARVATVVVGAGCDGTADCSLDTVGDFVVATGMLEGDAGSVEGEGPTSSKTQ